MSDLLARKPGLLRKKEVDACRPVDLHLFFIDTLAKFRTHARPSWHSGDAPAYGGYATN